jgi:hypothetical protein
VRKRGNRFGDMIADVGQFPGSALPLIVLPDISPRIVTGRNGLSSTISPITNVAEKVAAAG